MHDYEIAMFWIYYLKAQRDGVDPMGWMRKGEISWNHNPVSHQ